MKHPVRPIKETGRPASPPKKDWDANGDFALAIFQIVLWPFVMVGKVFKKLIH